MSKTNLREPSPNSIWAAFPDLTDYDSTAMFLSRLCPDGIKADTQQSLGSPESFACLLHRNWDLFDILKKARGLKNLEEFWTKCVALSRREEIRLTLGDYVSSIFDGMAPEMNNLVTGKATPPSWTLFDSLDLPDVLKLDVQGLRKKFASVPPMLFYELGSFAHDPVANERVNGLFCNGKNTFLVNASATGKTRLLLEGLCQRWGLYFTSRPDHGEASSLKVALNGHIAHERDLVPDLPRNTALGFDAILSRNREIAYRRFSDILLAHLLVFKHFLTAVFAHDGKVGENQKRRWLDAQLGTSVICRSDAYYDLSHNNLYWESSSTIDKQFQQVLTDIKLLLPESVMTDGFFVAIDEANDALIEIWVSLDEDTGPYPALKELILTWQKRLAQLDVPITFIVAGVEIPQSYFPPSSPEWSSWKWTSDTGSFNRKTQKQYIHSFLPPSVLETAAGEALMQRAWDWCQPRHRFTASLVAMLLMDDAKPHGVLNQYITRFTGYVTHEASEYIAVEGDCHVVPFFENVGTIIKGRPLVQSTTNEVIMHYIVTGKHPPYYGIGRIDIVSSGVGQFKDGDMQVISLDQPIPTIAAAVWLTTKKPHGESATPPHLSVPADSVDSTRSPSSERDEPPLPLVAFDEFCSHFQSRWDNGDTYASASYIALYFSHAFKDGNDLSLSDIFSVPSPPSWLTVDDTLMTQLVVLRKQPEDAIEEIIVDTQALLPTAPPVGYMASTPDEVLAWLQHERSGAFCICPPGCGAELIFILKRAGKYLWVVLRTVGRGRTTPVTADDVHSEIIDYLQVENLFSGDQVDTSSSDPLLNAFKAIPNPMAPAEQFSVLRVVATFPSDSPLPSEELKGPPVAVLKTSKFKAVTERLPTEELVDTLVASMHGKRMSIYPDNTFTPIIPLPPKPVDPPPSLAANKVSPRPPPKKRKSADIVTDDPAASTSSEKHTSRRSARLKALRSTTKSPALEVLEEDLTPRKRTKSA